MSSYVVTRADGSQIVREEGRQDIPISAGTPSPPSAPTISTTPPITTAPSPSGGSSTYSNLYTVDTGYGGTTVITTPGGAAAPITSGSNIIAPEGSRVVAHTATGGYSGYQKAVTSVTGNAPEAYNIGAVAPQTIQGDAFAYRTVVPGDRYTLDIDAQQYYRPFGTTQAQKPQYDVQTAGALTAEAGRRSFIESAASTSLPMDSGAYIVLGDTGNLKADVEDKSRIYIQSPGYYKYSQGVETGAPGIKQAFEKAIGRQGVEIVPVATSQGQTIFTMRSGDYTAKQQEKSFTEAAVRYEGAPPVGGMGSGGGLMKPRTGIIPETGVSTPAISTSPSIAMLGTVKETRIYSHPAAGETTGPDTIIATLYKNQPNLTPEQLASYTQSSGYMAPVTTEQARDWYARNVPGYKATGATTAPSTSTGWWPTSTTTPITTEAPTAVSAMSNLSQTYAAKQQEKLMAEDKYGLYATIPEGQTPTKVDALGRMADVGYSKLTHRGQDVTEKYKDVTVSSTPAPDAYYLFDQPKTQGQRSTVGWTKIPAVKTGKTPEGEDIYKPARFEGGKWVADAETEAALEKKYSTSSQSDLFEYSFLQDVVGVVYTSGPGASPIETYKASEAMNVRMTKGIQAEVGWYGKASQSSDIITQGVYRYGPTSVMRPTIEQGGSLGRYLVGSTTFMGKAAVITLADAYFTTSMALIAGGWTKSGYSIVKTGYTSATGTGATLWAGRAAGVAGGLTEIGRRSIYFIGSPGAQTASFLPAKMGEGKGILIKGAGYASGVFFTGAMLLNLAGTPTKGGLLEDTSAVGKGYLDTGAKVARYMTFQSKPYERTDIVGSAVVWNLPYYAIQAGQWETTYKIANIGAMTIMGAKHVSDVAGERLGTPISKFEDLGKITKEDVLIGGGRTAGELTLIESEHGIESAYDKLWTSTPVYKSVQARVSADVAAGKTNLDEYKWRMSAVDVNVPLKIDAASLKPVGATTGGGIKPANIASIDVTSTGKIRENGLSLRPDMSVIASDVQARDKGKYASGTTIKYDASTTIFSEYGKTDISVKSPVSPTPTIRPDLSESLSMFFRPDATPTFSIREDTTPVTPTPVTPTPPEPTPPKPDITPNIDITNTITTTVTPTITPTVHVSEPGFLAGLAPFLGLPAFGGGGHTAVSRMTRVPASIIDMLSVEMGAKSILGRSAARTAPTFSVVQTRASSGRTSSGKQPTGRPVGRPRINPPKEPSGRGPGRPKGSGKPKVSAEDKRDWVDRSMGIYRAKKRAG